MIQTYLWQLPIQQHITVVRLQINYKNITAGNIQQWRLLFECVSSCTLLMLIPFFHEEYHLLRHYISGDLDCQYLE